MADLHEIPAPDAPSTIAPAPTATGGRRRGARRRATAVAVGALALIGQGLVLPGAVPAAQAAPRTCVATAFRSNAATKSYYRIPAIVRTKAGTLLAFAERRRSTAASADISDTEIAMVRSTDNGCHWSKPKIIADQGKGTVGNPVPVLDRVTGAVLLFSTYRAPNGGSTYHNFHMQTITREGLTVTPYSKAGKDLAGIRGWAGGLTGPGHAIQLQSPRSKHRGRLVVQLGYKEGSRNGAYAVYSDDHGRSWHVGFKSAGTEPRIEGTIAELPDGRLWISYHDRNATAPVGKNRTYAFSSDGGATLSKGFTRSTLPIISIYGSSLAPGGTYAGRLLFSAPYLKDAHRRQGLGIFVSSGSGLSTRWSGAHVIVSDKQPVAYSDLVQIDDATFGVLYETGSRSWHERIDYRNVRFSSVR